MRQFDKLGDSGRTRGLSSIEAVVVLVLVLLLLVSVSGLEMAVQSYLFVVGVAAALLASYFVTRTAWG